MKNDCEKITNKTKIKKKSNWALLSDDESDSNDYKMHNKTTQCQWSIVLSQETHDSDDNSNDDIFNKRNQRHAVSSVDSVGSKKIYDDAQFGINDADSDDDITTTSNKTLIKNLNNI